MPVTQNIKLYIESEKAGQTTCSTIVLNILLLNNNVLIYLFDTRTHTVNQNGRKMA